MPIGPLHVSDEPGHFRLFVDGETLSTPTTACSGVHRGMEKLAETRMGCNEATFPLTVCDLAALLTAPPTPMPVENAMGIQGTVNVRR